MVSKNINDKFDSDCVNFSSMQRLEEKFDDLSDLRSLLGMAIFPGDGGIAEV